MELHDKAIAAAKAKDAITAAIKQQEDMLKLAKEEKAKAKETTKLAKEHAANWAKQAAATKARAEAAIKKAKEVNAQ